MFLDPPEHRDPLLSSSDPQYCISVVTIQRPLQRKCPLILQEIGTPSYPPPILNFVFLYPCMYLDTFIGIQRLIRCPAPGSSVQSNTLSIQRPLQRSASNLMSCFMSSALSGVESNIQLSWPLQRVVQHPGLSITANSLCTVL